VGFFLLVAVSDLHDQHRESTCCKARISMCSGGEVATLLGRNDAGKARP
jgi:ABC-type Na+ transport system ATPase subunit NatA